MRRHWKVAATLSLALVAGLLAPIAPAAAAKSYQVKQESYSVHTKYGDLYVAVNRPVDPSNPNKVVKGPAILTYSPYSVLFGYSRDASTWVPKGYVRIFADVIGTGNSGGCYDYGGKAEEVTGFDLVEWIAKQKWSNGKVAMMGGSYEGTTAWSTAIMQPPHLTTIIPEAAIDRWYDYAYNGGIRLFDNNEAFHEGAGAPSDEGIDTPLGFDFGFAIPPPVDPTDPGWQDRVSTTILPCSEVEHTMQGYNFDTPTYSKFWQERDYIAHANNIHIPVMISANWGDWNVQQHQSIDFYKALHNNPNVKLYMGNAFSGHGVPGGQYPQTVQAWMDHYMMGVNNNVQNMPDVHSQESNYNGPTDWYAGSWPKTTNVVLYAQEVPVTDPNGYGWMLMPDKPMNMKGMPHDAAGFPSSGVNTESHAAHHARNNHDWFWFESPMFKKDTRIFGSPVVQIYSTVYRKWITFTPSFFDVDMSTHKEVEGQHVATDPNGLVAATRGWLDTRYSTGLDKTVMIKDPNKPFETTVKLNPTDWVIKKGDMIGINIQTEIDEWSIAKQTDATCSTSAPDPTSLGGGCPYVSIDWQHAKTRVILPIVNAPKNPMDLFDFNAMHMH
jgi:putative CocE/NonD family hydrolase